jgi:hypothetical protein
VSDDAAFAAFGQALCDPGSVEGRNILVEHRYRKEMGLSSRARASDLIRYSRFECTFSSSALIGVVTASVRQEHGIVRVFPIVVATSVASSGCRTRRPLGLKAKGAYGLCRNRIPEADRAGDLRHWSAGGAKKTRVRIPNGIRYLWQRAGARDRSEAPGGVAHSPIAYFFVGGVDGLDGSSTSMSLSIPLPSGPPSRSSTPSPTTPHRPTLSATATPSMVTPSGIA